MLSLICAIGEYDHVRDLAWGVLALRALICRFSICRSFAIMGGLLVATIFTLVFLPTLYVTGSRGKEEQATS